MITERGRIDTSKPPAAAEAHHERACSVDGSTASSAAVAQSGSVTHNLTCIPARSAGLKSVPQPF